MKTRWRYMVIAVMSLIMIAGCGPSKKEKQKREQARQDSLQQVRRDSIQKMRKQKQDSMARANQDSMQKKSDEEASQRQVSFSDNGRYTLQIESWRSKAHAQKKAQMWKDRGFTHAYVTEYGNKETGDVWYRLRLGRVDSRQKAQELKQMLKDKYQTDAWIDTAH